MEEKVEIFLRKTTAHGLSNMATARDDRGRRFWALIFIFCSVVFATQAYFLVERFNRRDTNTDVKLRFDDTSFPAVTICNLNPYKASLVSQVPEIQQTLAAYERAKGVGAEMHRQRRRKRSALQTRHEPIFARCKCVAELTTPCLRFGNAPSKESETCICSFNTKTQQPWPCYSAEAWKEDRCATCHDNGICSKGPSRDRTCLCVSNGTAPYCLAKPADDIKSYWQLFALSPPVTTPSPEFVQAMGFSGMTDQVAITTRAKENLVFTMASLPAMQRVSLSQQKDELIQLCSFNGQQCDIDRDFRLHVDPVFGNCYTFNYDMSRNFTSSRAGPMYGVRLQLYVNTSDYMEISEAAGVRVAIHGQTTYPFPDVFGHSAPTGAISSFGIRRIYTDRMPAPYGDCLKEKVDDTYIYPDYDYHSEGCYRSCFQLALIKACRCGDPRFPVPKNQSHCSAVDGPSRRCLEKKLSEIGDFSNIHDLNCNCKQPCQDINYVTTYSASKWPSGASDVGDCEELTNEECTLYYQKHAAIVEVYYKRLGYDYLKESEAYGWVNLVADFGGQLGLWLGFSVITCMEFVVLGWDLLTVCCSRGKNKKTKKIIKKRDSEQGVGQPLNSQNNEPLVKNRQSLEF